MNPRAPTGLMNSFDSDRSAKLLQLAAASADVNARTSVPGVLEAIVDHARRIVGAGQALVRCTLVSGWPRSMQAVSYAEEYLQEAIPDLPFDNERVQALVEREDRAVRLSEAELDAMASEAAPVELSALANHSPRRGCLAVPLYDRARAIIGVLQLWEPLQGEFGAEDEALLVHFGEFAGLAVQNAQLLAHARQEEERMRLALQSAAVGTWDLDPTTGTLRWDARCRELFGLSPQAHVDLAVFFQAIHPEDREATRAAVERALDPSGDGAFACEYRSVGLEDSRVRWLEAAGRAFFEDGRATRFVGVVLDVTDRRFALEAAARARRDPLARAEKFSALVEKMSDFVGLASFEGELLFINGAGRRMVGLKGPDDVLGRPLMDLFMAEDRRKAQQFLSRSMRAGEGAMEFRVRHFATNRPIDVWWSLFLLDDRETGRPVALATIIRDITEDKQAKAALEQSSRALVEADRRKDEFLAMLGHELRNPLAPIVTALELMDLQGVGAEREREVIGRQVRHMKRLVDDLLDISRIIRGKFQLKTEVFEVGEAIQQAIEMSSPMLEKQQQRLEVHVPEEGLRVRADRGRIAQVVSNLLTNAAKYTPAGGHIEIRAEAEGERHVRVVVEDDGVGIDAELLPRIFDLFSQGRQSIERAQGGLGLGLPLVKGIVELHGGRVQAQSDGPGAGSRFELVLPGQLGKRKTVETRPVVEDGQPAPHCSILIVDDNIDAAELLAEVLGQLGHEVVLAHDGPSALAEVARFEPDVALLDIGLPVMDGYELGRRLRAKYERIKLIAITGYGQDRDRARSESAGFDLHLTKPVELSTIKEAVRRVQET